MANRRLSAAEKVEIRIRAAALELAHAVLLKLAYEMASCFRTLQNDRVTEIEPSCFWRDSRNHYPVQCVNARPHFVFFAGVLADVVPLAGVVCSWLTNLGDRQVERLLKVRNVVSRR
jgi:hypothetical protein